MSTPKIFINEKYKKKNGTSAVYILVHLGGKSIKFPTGVSCDPDNFDYSKNKIKGNSKIVRDDNLIIQNSISRINDIFVRYRLQMEELTPEVLKKEWKRPTRRISFYTWLEEAIKERKGEIAEGSISQHEALVSKMKDFTPKLTFAEIDPEFIEKFRRHLKVKKKNDINTIHNNLKNLKAYLNIAKRQGVIKDNPFEKVKLKRTSSDRVFLNKEELKSLWDLYHSKRLLDNLYPVLRHFLFMCLTGIRISDLLEMRFENIHNNQMVFFPKKTRGQKRIGVRVPLNKYALQLIKDEGKKQGTIFNPFSEQRMNLKLKDIVKVAGIPKKITNHSGRHTFATLYLKETKDLAGLQKLLGHSNISQTMIYVHITEEELLETMGSFEGKLEL